LQDAKSKRVQEIQKERLKKPAIALKIQIGLWPTHFTRPKTHTKNAIPKTIRRLIYRPKLTINKNGDIGA
jgi:hypothetical protein